MSDKGFIEDIRLEINKVEFEWENEEEGLIKRFSFDIAQNDVTKKAGISKVTFKPKVSEEKKGQYMGIPSTKTVSRSMKYGELPAQLIEALTVWREQGKVVVDTPVSWIKNDDVKEGQPEKYFFFLGWMFDPKDKEKNKGFRLVLPESVKTEKVEVGENVS